MACSACGAAADLERPLLFEDETARACMACGAVRVNEVTVEYSDNPHVDPRTIAKPVKLDGDALAWVSAFPRRTSYGGFMAASVRAKTKEELAREEEDADGAKGSLSDRIRAVYAPAHAPPPFASWMDPFRHVIAALILSPESALVGGLVLAESRTIAGEVARDWLAARGNVLGEVAASIHTLRPANVAVAINAARATATPSELDALSAAIRDMLAKTDPYSSDVAALRASLDKLR